jgi:hypothetical protein
LVDVENYERIIEPWLADGETIMTNTNEAV